MQGPKKTDPLEVKSPSESAPDALVSLAPGVVQEIRRTLVAQETVYQQNAHQDAFSSLWAHSARVARIAHYIAVKERREREPALLAGLLHDIGKFAHGCYHEDGTPEEEHAARFVKQILSGTDYERWIATVNEAILSMYMEGKKTSAIGEAVYDADNLDKLGHMGVAQFFTKSALRGRFLDDDLMIRTSIELTYAHHAPDTLKTAAGRAIARERSLRTRRFYEDLLAEWTSLGLRAFDIVEEDIAGIVCILVAPRACSCGSRLRLESDIQDAIKCRSLAVRYRCGACGMENEFSFCLPNVKGLPPKR